MGEILNYLKTARRGAGSFFRDKPLDPFPIRHSLKDYEKGNFSADLRAALNVFFLAVPQGMAYAAIANLPLVAGIISGAVASLIAPIFSSSRFTNIGPTNATSLMLFSFFSVSVFSPEQKLAVVPLLILLVGIFCTIGAFFKFAELLQFVSRSVLVGYITGAATLIIAGQLKHVLGVAELMNPTQSFLGTIAETFKNIPNTGWQTFFIGSLSLVLYLLFQSKVKRVPAFGVTLILMSLLTWVLKELLPEMGFSSVAFFKDITLSALSPVTPWHVKDLYGTVKMLIPVALALSFLASLENTVMSKSLATQSGTQSDVNQDMLSLGLSNISSAFIGGMPVSGSLTRSALNFSSGARTGVSTFMSGLFCLLGVFLLAKFGLVSQIPKACLAALVIGVALSLIKWENIRVCLQSTADDAIVIISTFLATLLLPLHIAIFIGVILSLILFLRKASKPSLVEYEFSEDGDLRARDMKQARPNPQISIVHVEGALYFGAAELFRTQIQRIAQDPNIKAIVLRMKNAMHLDATSVLALTDLIKFAREQSCHVLISGMSKDVYKILKRAGVLSTIQEGCNKKEGETNIFMHLPSNPNISTRDALIRAQHLLGTKEADIKIFFDPSKK